MPRKVKKAAKQRGIELSRSLVIETALRLIDADGLEGFSLRNIAKELEVFPTAVYWYVSSREQILAAVVWQTLKDVVPEFDGSDWKRYVAELMVNFRRALQRHPNVAPLVLTQIGNTSIDLMLVENNLRAMSAAGFSGTDSVQGHNVIMAALTGFSVQEMAPLPKEAKEWRAEIRARIKAISADRYPAIHALLPDLVNRSFILRWESGNDAPLDESFDVFVQTVIAGLEVRANQALSAQLSGKRRKAI